MTTCGWVLLGLVVIFFTVPIAVYPKSWNKYWREGCRRIRLCWNNGWILPVLKAKFFFLSCLSFGVIAPYCIEKRCGSKSRYWFVDSYVAIWVIFIGILSWRAITNTPCLTPNCVLGFLSYRLFEIFQSWISQYILGGVPRRWETRNIYRNLVLVLVDYGEVIFSYALLAFILQNNFCGITNWQQSLHYSLGNAVTIGSNNIVPTTGIGYVLFATQLMFTLLFLVVAVNRIIAAMKLTSD